MTDKISFNFPEFSDDAFAEIDENLVKIRNNLLKLEEFTEKRKVNKPLINDLLISFHTIKGISGMVGIIELQNLAHTVESFLKQLNKIEAAPSREAFDLMIKGIRLIENVLDYYKNSGLKYDMQTDQFGIIKYIESFKSIKPDAEEKPQKSIIVSESLNAIFNSLDEITVEKIQTIINAGKSIFKLEFIPSPQLFQKGINVNSIRNNLSDLGEIITSSPSKTPDGKISFEFVFLSDQEKKLNEIFTKENISFQKIHTSTRETIISSESSPVKIEQLKNGSQQDENTLPQKTTLATANMVRVELSRLDDLMRMVGELVINRARLDATLKSSSNQIPTLIQRSLQETNQSMERQLRYLREGIMRVRLVPMGEVFERMQFVVREIISDSHKSIKLEISGKETEIDKYVVERIFDPLMHIVRNSVSHGIELPEERKSFGKSEEGKIKLSAHTSGDAVVIEIEDDGRGVDKEFVLKKAIDLQLILPQTEINDSILFDILAAPGFSTRESADLVSGRGVGMSVVKNVIQELGGTIDLETELNKGTKFTIHIPLTLAIVDALIVSVNEQTYAIPQPFVNEVIELEKSQIKQLENNEIISYRGKLVPLIYLSKYFNLQNKDLEHMNAILVGSEKNSVGLVVDKIKTSREIVVHTLSDPIVQSTGISGATELGDGKAVLIIDAPSLIRGIKQKTIYN